MLKRNAEWLPKLFPKEDSILLIFNKNPSHELISQAANGIVDIQEFHDLNMLDIVQGILQHPVTGVIYKSYKKLTFNEVVILAKSAKTSGYLGGVNIIF